MKKKTHLCGQKKNFLNDVFVVEINVISHKCHDIFNFKFYLDRNGSQ